MRVRRLPRIGRIAGIVALAGLLATGSGCSFFVSRTVSDEWKPEQPPECRPRPLPPLADTAAAIASFVIAAAFWQLADSCVEAPCSHDRKPIYLFAGVGAVTTVSAGVGYLMWRDCARAHRQHADYLREQGPPAAQGAPGPAPASGKWIDEPGR